MARDGFTTVERKDDGSMWLVNPQRGEEHKLAGVADAKVAELVISRVAQERPAKAAEQATQA